MNITVRVVIFLIASLLPTIGCGASLTADQALQHVGQTASVCGSVASTTYATQSRGRPTFLNLDKAYPNETFTIVIWEEDRSKFGAPERSLSGKTVCATGVIQLYRGRPEIIVRETAQLEQQ